MISIVLISSPSYSSVTLQEIEYLPASCGAVQIAVLSEFSLIISPTDANQAKLRLSFFNILELSSSLALQIRLTVPPFETGLGAADIVLMTGS